MESAIIKPKSGNAKTMVMFLHGYGSNKDDLIGIGSDWQEALPDTVFVSPNAPEICEQFDLGYQWFSLRSIDARAMEGIKDAVPKLNKYIDEQLKEWNIEEKNLVVVGFSQGAMMADYTMPRRKKACAGIVSYSGLLVDADGLKGLSIVKMPVLAMHGEDDDVVPPFNLNEIEKGFEDAGFEIETIMRPNLGHGIDYFGIKRGLDFVSECLTKK